MALCTLAEAKAELNLSGSAYDTELQAYIDALPGAVEPKYGVFENRSVTEVVGSTGWVIRLMATPVAALTSFTSISDGSVLDVSTLFVAVPLAGLVQRKDGGPIVGGPWTAVYTAGRGSSVPASANLAGRKIVAHLWRSQRGRTGPAVGAEEEVLIPGLPYAVPRGAAELLALYARPPAVA